MELDKMLLDDFAEITHDKKEKLQDVTCYGTAVVQDGNEYVRLDAADSLTPATFAVRAHHGDRVMVMIKNHRATVIANITTPSMTLGILNVTDGIIVQGYLTTNEDRTAYDDQTNYGLTFSAGGIGGYGGSGKYWYLTNAGDLYASSAEIIGNITAESGYLGSSTNGFKIDEYGIYSGNDKSGTTTGFIVLANGDFARTINNVSHADLRFAIGANFAVSSSGVLYATNVDATGKITASSGYIGNATNGFTIDSDGFYSGPRNDRGTAATGNIAFSNTSFTRLINGTSRTDLRFAIGSNFGVDNTGKLYAAGIEVTGKIDATSGTIGSGTNKITIGTNSTNASIYYGMSSRDDTTNNGFYIGTDGIALGQGKFKVTNTGSFTATTGTIGPWSVNSTSIYRNSSTHGAANGLYFGTSGLSITDKFQVNSAGKLTATGADIGGTITATDGSIAGWQIGTNAIYRANSGTTASEAFNTAGVLYFGTSGISLSNKFSVTSTGSLMASDGTIGPWKIGANAIYRGTNATDTSFNTSGALYFGTQGLSLSDKFSVTSAGALTAISGDIAGWSIGEITIQKETGATTTAGTYQYKVYLHAPNSPTTGSNAIAIQRKLHGASNYDTNSLFAITYGGYIKAIGGGTIGSWTLGASGTTNSQTVGSLYYCPSGKSFGQDGTIYLIPHGTTASTTIAGRAGTDWVVTAGSKFGVTNSGALYASSATVSGTINATNGSIGPWSIESYGIYKNGGWVSSNTGAAYIGNNGLSITDKFYVTDTGALYVANGVSVSLLSNYHFLDLCKKLSSSAGYFSDTIGYIGTWHGDVGIMYYSKNELWLRSDTNQVLISANDANAVSFAANYDSNSIVLCANRVAASGALSVSGSIAISTTGRGFNLTDSSGTTYGGIYDNGDNLWIGSASSTSPHHRGSSGNTFISSGYSTTNAAGNSTIWIWVPTLSGTTWSGTSYGVLHSGNYSTYALPKTGGSLSGALSVSGNISSTNEIHAGGKGTASDGKAGSILSTSGHLYMQGASGSHIYFYYGTSTSVTSQLYESASGTLRVSGDFTVDGVVRTPGTWSNTTTNSANVRVIDQYGQLQRYSSSSKRYKHDIVAITDYKKVLDIPVVTFKYNKGYISDKDQRFGLSIPGFIAEEVEKCYPIAAEWVEGKIEDWNARYIIPPMLAVEQEHERRIKELEYQINELKAEIAVLKGVA